jgi:hypothetical protein
LLKKTDEPPEHFRRLVFFVSLKFCDSARGVISFFSALVTRLYAHSNISSRCPSPALLPDAVVVVPGRRFDSSFPTREWNAFGCDPYVRDGQADLATLWRDAGTTAHTPRVLRGYQSGIDSDEEPNPELLSAFLLSI